MNFKRLVFIYAIINILIAAFLGLYLLKPIPTRVMEFDGIKGNFPAWKAEDYWMGNGWKGTIFNDKLAEFRVLISEEKEEGGEPIFEKNTLIYRKEIDSFPAGIYYFVKKSHGYLVMYSFHIGKKAYWIDMNSYTKLSKYRDFFNKFLQTMTVEGRPSAISSADLETHFSWKIIRRNSTVFFMATGSILFLSVLFLMLFPLFGSCHKSEGNCYSLAIFKTGKGISSRARPCCVCFTEEEVVIKTWLYKPVKFPISEIDFSRAEKGKIRGKDFEIYLNQPLDKTIYQAS